MAASGRHVGHCIQRNGRFLANNFEQLWGHRSFGWTPALQQQAAEVTEANTVVAESTENIVIPRKKTWSKVALLEALASTVSRDITAYSYQFQDDSYLTARTPNEFKMYYLAQDSGRSAAKFFINSNPKYFTKDYAEPHIPCLMPEIVTPSLEEVSEAALKERINLRKVKAAVDMYDQLLQSGTAVSMETTHCLLDLICLYCDGDSVPENETENEDMEESESSMKFKRIRIYQAVDRLKSTWKENNNAERIFNLLPERDTRCYSALIRGMVKHEAYEKAFSMYINMLNAKVAADVHIFNALLIAVPNVRDNYREKLDLITELLTQMNQQKVRPNLLTFNSVLKSMRRCGAFVKSKALLVLNEMKALGIAPSLATYEHILVIFSKQDTGHSLINVMHQVLSELAGTSLTCQDPGDVIFFTTAMKICLENKDLELGYKVHNLLEVGENWKLLGDSYQQSIYYGRLFNLVCLMEEVDAVLKWYNELIPSLYYPNAQAYKDLLQALDTGNRLDLLSTLWKDIKSIGHHKKLYLVTEVLNLMARDKHSPEVQESFAECALDIKLVFDGEERRPGLEWNTSSLSNITCLLLQANKTKQAWEMLQLFKSNNKVPTQELLNNFLSVCHSDGSSQRAVELVQLSAAFCLPATANLAKKTLDTFELTDDQRAILSELVSAGEPLTEGGNAE